MGGSVALDMGGLLGVGGVPGMGGVQCRQCVGMGGDVDMEALVSA